MLLTFLSILASVVTVGMTVCVKRGCLNKDKWIWWHGNVDEEGWGKREDNKVLLPTIFGAVPSLSPLEKDLLKGLPLLVCST